MGTFKSAQPLAHLFSKIISKSSFISYIQNAIGIDYPPIKSTDTYELLHLCLLKAKENLQRHFSNIQLVFLFFPGATENFQDLYEFMKEKNDFIVIGDYFRDSKKTPVLKELIEKNEFMFPDQHPKPVVYKYLSEWLTEDLKNLNLIP